MLTNEELINRCKKQDAAAQKALYDNYNTLLMGVCIRYTKSKSDADDIFQEGFIKILTNIDKHQWQGKSSFESWMKTIMANTAIKHYHKSKKESTIEYADDLTEHEDNFEEPDQSTNNEESSFTQQDLLEALNRLPDEFRIVFNLHVIEGLKHNEIAQKLDIKERTSRSRLGRARKKLQKELSKLKKEKQITLSNE